jgi:hypothetical protein
MRAPLSSIYHSESCEKRAVTMAVFRRSMTVLARVLAELATRPYAQQVYGYWSHATFVVATAASDDKSHEGSHYDIFCIEPSEPDGRYFLVGSAESPQAKWGYCDGKRVGRWKRCLEHEIVPLIDAIMERQLPSVSGRG